MGSLDIGFLNKQIQFAPQMLKRHGLPENVNDCIGMLSRLIRDHEHFGRLLTSIEPDVRVEFYERCKPNLKFKPHSLEKYIADVKSKMASENVPSIGSNGELIQRSSTLTALDTLAGHAEQSIAKSMAKHTLTLKCSKCTTEGVFFAVGMETPLDVVLRARRDGWVHDAIVNPAVEICPHCPSSLRKNG